MVFRIACLMFVSPGSLLPVSSVDANAAYCLLYYSGSGPGRYFSSGGAAGQLRDTASGRRCRWLPWLRRGARFVWRITDSDVTLV